MPVSGVGNNSNVSGTSYKNNVNSKLGKSELGYEDFITLLTAQLKNQNMFDPASDTEFIAQMAQFSALQQMNNLIAMIQTSQAISFVGKTVIVKTFDSSNNVRYISGVVESVSFENKTPLLLVNNKYYALSDITDIIADFGGEMMEV